MDELNAKHIDHDYSQWEPIGAEHMRLNELYIRQFSKILRAEGEGASQVVRTSFYFAYELGENLAGEIDHYDFGTYLAELARLPLVEQHEILQADVQMYLADNAEVEGIVASYSDYLSHSNDEYLEISELVAGATLMMVDQSLVERYVDRQNLMFDRELTRLLNDDSQR